MTKFPSPPLTLLQIRRQYGRIQRDLFDAVLADSTPGVKQALSGGNIDINRWNGELNVLQCAAGFASPEIVEILLDQGASLLSSSEGCTALHMAACEGMIANICLLLSRGAEIEAVDKDGKTPIYTATTNGQAKAVEVLAAKGANVNHRTLRGTTPMHSAIRQNRLDIVKILLCAEADIEISFGNLTPLDLAVYLDHPEIYEELMRFCNPSRWALECAASANTPRAIEMMYDAGARDTTGQALCVAISERHVECVKTLLRCTATNSHAGQYIDGARMIGRGWLAIVLHERTPSVKIVRLLVDAGADTTSAIGVQLGDSAPFASTPLQCFEMALDADSEESGIGEARLGALKGIIRLLKQVSAVHATSWLWPWPKTAAWGKRVEKSAAIARMLPVLRRRAAKRHVLLGALVR